MGNELNQVAHNTVAVVVPVGTRTRTIARTVMVSVVSTAVVIVSMGAAAVCARPPIPNLGYGIRIFLRFGGDTFHQI